MLRRPSVRLVLTTVSAAALLAGGIDLASYAASGRHQGSGASASHKTALPKTITFTLGTNGQNFGAGSAHLFTAKVPKGTYAASISGFIADTSGTPDGGYTCLIADKKALLHLLHHPSSLAGTQRIYSAAEQDESQASFGFGLVNDHNPVAKVDRSTIVYGCSINGTNPVTVARPLKFALTPVKASNQKGKKFTLPTAKAAKLARALR
jgi:hypothetical protein